MHHRPCSVLFNGGDNEPSGVVRHLGADLDRTYLQTARHGATDCVGGIVQHCDNRTCAHKRAFRRRIQGCLAELYAISPTMLSEKSIFENN